MNKRKFYRYSNTNLNKIRKLRIHFECFLVLLGDTNVIVKTDKKISNYTFFVSIKKTTK